MQIKLKWVNNNDSTAVVEVFRGTAPIDTANPGAPLATLPGNATTYTDASVLAGVTYYYAVAVSRNGKKIFTPVKTFLNEYRRGPGGSRILYGDERLGYMGSVSQDDFIEIGRVLMLSTALNSAHRMTWHKFIRNGKIVYFGEKPMNTTVSSEKVHAGTVRSNIGFVSGMTWNFNNSTWADANKTRIVEKNGDRFHFRAPRSLADDWDGTDPTAEMIANPQTEFNEIIPTLFMGGEFYFPNKIGCVRNGLPYSTVNMGSILCAERFNNGNSLQRNLYKTNPTSNNFWTRCNTNTRTKDDFLGFKSKPFTGSEPSWNGLEYDLVWPVLELIE